MSSFDSKYFKDRHYAPPVPVSPPVNAPVTPPVEPPVVAAARAKAIAPSVPIAPPQPPSPAEPSAILPRTVISMSDLPAKAMPVPVQSFTGHGWLIQIYKNDSDFVAEITFAGDIAGKRLMRLRSDSLGRVISESHTFAAQGLQAVDLEPPTPTDPRYKRIVPTTAGQLQQESELRALLESMKIEDK